MSDDPRSGSASGVPPGDDPSRSGDSSPWRPVRASHRPADSAGTRAAAHARIRALLRVEPPSPVQRMFWRAVERSYIDRPEVLLHLCDALTDRGASIARLAETFFASGQNRIGTALELLSLAEDDPERLPGFELLDPDEQALSIELSDALAEAVSALTVSAERGGLDISDLETALFRAASVAERLESLPAARRWLVAAQCETRVRIIRDALAEGHRIIEHRRNRLRVLGRLGRSLERMLPQARNGDMSGFGGMPGFDGSALDEPPDVSDLPDLLARLDAPDDTGRDDADRVDGALEINLEAFLAELEAAAQAAADAAAGDDADNDVLPFDPDESDSGDDGDDRG